MSATGGSGRAFRGGSWGDVYARYLRSSYRDRIRPEFRSDYLGFRCVREDSRKPSKLARGIADELRRLK